MATVRIQVRRGTGSDWTNVNPVLAAGELGIETNTRKLKVGDGTTAWNSLSYIAADAPEIGEISQDAINTALTMGSGLTKSYNDGANTITISVDSDVIALKSYVDSEITATEGYADSAVSTHNADTTSVHGIADTSALATKTYADNAATTAGTSATTTASNALSSHNSATTLVHGIADTANLATTFDLADSITDHNAVTINVHGIPNTAALTTKAYVDSEIATLGNQAADTYIPSSQIGVSGGLATLDSNGYVPAEQLDLNTAQVAENIQNRYFTELRAKDAVGQTFVAGSNLTKDYTNGVLTVDLDNSITLTGNVTADEVYSNAITVDGDASVDNLTVGGNLTVNGTTTTVNATDLSVTDPMIYMGDGNQSNSLDLGFVAAFNDGTYQHSGLVKDATDGVWKLFRGVTDEPSSTINFAQAEYETLKLGNLQTDSAAIGNVSNQELQYLNGATSNIQDQLDDKAPLASPTFTGTVILPNDTVLTSNISTGAVTTDKIANSAVTQAKLGSDSVSTIKIVDEAVTSAKIFDSAVITSKIADSAVTSAKLVSDAVTTDKITAESITAAKIASDAITTVKIMDGNVTTAKLGALSVTAAKLAADAVVTTKIADLAVETAKLADGAVTTDKIQGAAVTESKIDTSAVTTGKIANSAVTTEKLNASSVTAEKISPAAVETAGLATGAVTAVKLATDAVTTVKIENAAVTNAKLAGSIDQSKITDLVSDLALKAPLASPTFTGTVTLPSGTVTSGMIADGTIVNADINASAAIDWTKLAVSSTVSATELGYVDGVTSSIQTQLDSKLASASAASTYAPLASPALTGTPTAPTATAGTNTTQVATTQFVTGAVNDLIASAPGALNTLDELAAALGDDANFATTVTNSLATKAPIASPTFTGTVTVAASGIAFTDGTQTKEGVPSRTAITYVTGAYNLSSGGLSLRDQLIEGSSASGFTITIPANSTTAYPVGTSIDILQTNAGQITIAGDAGVTVNATPGLKLRAQWSSATLFKRATDTWIVMGDLSA